MRSIIPIVSIALLLSSCGESPEPPTRSSASTPPASTPASSPPVSASSRTPEAKSAGTEVRSVAPASSATGSGDPTAGEALFKQQMIAGVPGCLVCHSLEPGVRMVGPSLADAATVASGALAGTSAEDYLRQSIVEPDAHITEGFTPGLMFQEYGDTLSEQQINDLVAFLAAQS